MKIRIHVATLLMLGANIATATAHNDPLAHAGGIESAVAHSHATAAPSIGLALVAAGLAIAAGTIIVAAIRRRHAAPNRAGNLVPVVVVDPRANIRTRH